MLIPILSIQRIPIAVLKSLAKCGQRLANFCLTFPCFNGNEDADIPYGSNAESRSRTRTKMRRRRFLQNGLEMVLLQPLNGEHGSSFDRPSRQKLTGSLADQQFYHLSCFSQNIRSDWIRDGERASFVSAFGYRGSQWRSACKSSSNKASKSSDDSRAFETTNGDCSVSVFIRVLAGGEASDS